MNKLEFLDYSHVEKLYDSDDIKERVKFNPEYISEVKEFFNADPKDRITLLQSVRGENEVPQYVKDFVSKVESEGKKVYIPFHYNYQKDETGGVQICNNMRLAVEQAGTIAVAYNPGSEGTKFDFGISIYHDKPVVLLNPDLDLQNDLLYQYMKIKSGIVDDFNNIKFGVDENRIITQTEFDSNVKNNKLSSLILNYFAVEGKSPKLTSESALNFGFIFASKTPYRINIVNRLMSSDLPGAEYIRTTSIDEQLRIEESFNNMKSYTRVATILEKIFSLEKLIPNHNIKFKTK